MLHIKNLECGFEGGFKLSGVSLRIYEGQRVGLVGESGSGKSLISNMILRLYPQVVPQKGSIEFNQKNLFSYSEKSMRKIRGKEIAYVAQEPLSSLNPLQKVGKQILESLILHCRYLSKKEMYKKLDDIFFQVGLHPELKNRYPYELSGGQRQRVAIGMGVINKPKLLICDEPTTALDARIQKQILELLYQLSIQNNMAILLISHDLGVIKRFVDRIYVAKEGMICEEGSVEEVFSNPKNPYTKNLLDALKLPKKLILPTNEKVLEIRNFAISYAQKKFLFKQTQNQILSNINFSLYQRETLGIVGESGSGKSSLAMGILRLIKSRGEEYLLNKRIDNLNKKTLRTYRKNLQIVFQDPYASLNPRMRTYDIIFEALRLDYQKNQNYIQIITQILESVGLGYEYIYSYPHQLSGGQRQRVAIARAIALKPKVIILDEPTSALDKSMQKIVIDLLLNLQKEFGLSYLFISHDLDVIEAMCDKVMVLKEGKAVEYGDVKAIFKKPKNHYTQELLHSRINCVQ
ncbi:peptide ABC transporter ATP-binding protein [Helicobacter sp. 11S03491-1]|nr:peptide ABC transporter ATP-binding protein [Helicobacter sp. 11S03491-1]